MGILKSLFGGGSAGDDQSFIYESAEIVVQNDAEKEFLNQTQSLANGKKYEQAVRGLLQFMDLHPERRRFCLFTTATVLRACLHDQGVGAVDPCVFGDPRLDAIFMHCPRDNSLWLPMNQIKGGHYVSTSGRDPSQCPKCGKRGTPGRPEQLRPAQWATASAMEIGGVREHPAGSWTLGQGKRAVCAVIITRTAGAADVETIKLDHPDIGSQTTITAYEGRPGTDTNVLSALATRWFMEQRVPFSQGLFASHGFAGVQKLEYVIMKGY